MAKFPRLITLPIAAALILSACGGGATPTPAGSTAASTPPASSEASGGSSAPGSSAVTSGSITVTSLWGGSEQDAFQKVLDAFKAKTGITATYQAQRTDYATVLQSKITSGSPPDVAIMPGLGFLRQFARSGGIKKISDLGIDPASLDANYPPGILDPGKVDGELYGLMVKFNSKSTFWYRPDKFTTAGAKVPASWDDLKAALDTLKSKGSATPLGLGAKDSWTLTDWFEEVYLRQNGADAYKTLFSPTGNWTDATVSKAITTMTEVINDKYVVGGIKGALGVAFTDGIAQAFGATAKADAYYEGGFVGGIATGQVNKDLKIGTTIDWFNFPTFGGAGDTAAEIGGDEIAALTTNPGVKEFIQFMASADAGTTWAKTGAIISPVKAVDPSAYPNDLAKKEAAQVAGASAVVYDGSDTLPAGAPDMGAMLQDAIQGKDVAGLLGTFNTGVTAAWAGEK
ncbi:MAG TPA: extracellular solute-binding protein [Candidatus Limnocylindrales bacterium]|nr:extracellular solute-binding protein [Candidatus Limnocylindrales bacterium]